MTRRSAPAWGFAGERKSACARESSQVVPCAGGAGGAAGRWTAMSSRAGPAFRAKMVTFVSRSRNARPRGALAKGKVAHRHAPHLEQRFSAAAFAGRAGSQVLGEGMDRHGRARGVAPEVQHDVPREMHQHGALGLGRVEDRELVAVPRALDVHRVRARDGLAHAVCAGSSMPNFANTSSKNCEQSRPPPAPPHP
jgi:hypothetical protein